MKKISTRFTALTLSSWTFSLLIRGNKGIYIFCSFDINAHMFTKDQFIFQISLHAEERMNQRGISNDHIMATYYYGEERRRKGNITEYVLTNKAFKKALTNKSINDCIKKLIMEAKNITFICKDNLIITTFKSYKKWREKWK